MLQNTPKSCYLS